jgi:uncharacterized protein YeeX (DUF496 family)
MTKTLDSNLDQGTSIRVIDTDPLILRRYAECALHSANEAWIHMAAEEVGDIPKLMATLRAEGPYGYTIQPRVLPDGTVSMPICTTYQEIEAAYHQVRGASDMLGAEAVIEIRAAWYNFHEVMARGRRKGQDQINENNLIGLFPVSSDKGITGELVWVRIPRERLGKSNQAEAPVSDLKARVQLLRLHDQYIDALNRSDIEGILETMNDDVQATVRNYVNDTGALISLDGKQAHRDYYRALFDKYDLGSVVLLQRAVQEWYAFAELRFELRRRSDGAPVAFHIADYFIPASDNRFIMRVGHGTDPA